MAIISVALFFFYFWGFGFGVMNLLKIKEGSFLERQIMRTGIGAAALIITAMLLNLARIPLDWKIFLLLASLYPAIYLVKNFKTIRSKLQPKIKLKKSDLYSIGVILIFLGSLYMYATGAFSYPYLENDDPWGHASGAKYIAEEKTFAASEYRDFQYMNPYPPSYDFIFALMHQTESSLYWTLKFFNAVIISLSLVYFYFFAKEFIGNTGKALFAVIVLAAVPAYLSHFIWAPALAMMMFFPALYSLEMIKHDKKWKWIAGLTIGGLLVSHPTHTLTLFAMIGIYLLIKLIADKDLKTYAIAGVTGVLTSLTWWGTYGKAFFKSNIAPSAPLEGQPVLAESASIITKILHAIPSVFFKWSGTASRPYTFNDFFYAKGQNLINNPIGFGVAVSILGMVGLLFVVFRIIKLAKGTRIINRNNSYLIITLLWFILTFTIVNNLTFDLPLGFFAFRTWMILAVPVAIIAAEGLWGLFAVLSALKLEQSVVAAGKIALVTIAVIGILLTAGQQKYEVNTANWPPGAFWTSFDELNAYVWLKTLPDDTKVFSFKTDDQVVAMDKYSCGWCKAEAEYRKSGLDDSAQEMANWFKRNGYEYLIIGGMEIKQFGQNRTVSKINEIANSGLFVPAYQTNGAIVLKVV